MSYKDMLAGCDMPRPAHGLDFATGWNSGRCYFAGMCRSRTSGWNPLNRRTGKGPTGMSPGKKHAGMTIFPRPGVTIDKAPTL